jgi:hypothetical protein
LIGKGKLPCSIAYPDLHKTERNDTNQRKEEGRQETETDRGQRTGGKEKRDLRLGKEDGRQWTDHVRQITEDGRQGREKL